MQIKMAAVISMDGKITRGDGPHKREWISDEDKAYFNRLLDEYDLIVMGRKTYTSMALVPQEGKKYVVVTRSPELYQDRTAGGSIDFSKATPRQIVEKYEQLGFGRLLLLGGGSLYAAFLNASLVNEIDLTIEPIILGSGTNLTEVLDSSVHLHLNHQSQLNKRGTLFLNLDVQNFDIN